MIKSLVKLLKSELTFRKTVYKVTTPSKEYNGIDWVNYLAFTSMGAVKQFKQEHGNDVEILKVEVLL